MAHGGLTKQEDGASSSHDDFLDHDADHDSASGPPSPAGDDDNATHDKPTGPMQKRRRVTRACDECRRKKIKCDGKQPCTHCTVYSYECTYDQPSNRRRNPVPAYVEALEARVHLAEGLIRMIAPNLDLNDPALEIAVRHGYIPGLKPGDHGPAQVPTQDTKAAFSQIPAAQPMQTPTTIKQEPDLESMIKAVGQIDLDEHGQWDYHGQSSGLTFIRRMREHLGDLMGPDVGSSPFIKSRAKTSQVIESPRSGNMESPMDASSPLTDLPNESLARGLCENAVNRYSTLLCIVHVPSFWKHFRRIYTVSADHYTTDDLNFVTLMYSAMALGRVYAPSAETQGYETAIEQGYKYFQMARQMVDMADIRHLTLIQAMTFMIMFLQTSAKLSQCYGYIGVAMRASIRMGLHRSLPATSFRNPLESEMRKRVFWSLRKLDVYTGALLGLPPSLSDDEIDQDFPAEVDDDYLTEEGIRTMPAESVSALTTFNASTRLVHILSKTVRTIYPVRPQNGDLNKSYTVPFSKIREIEQDLETWKAELPPALDPSNMDPKMKRPQKALRLTYSFNQILLYRPFLHFVEADKRAKQTDQRAYACAASYIHVCRNLIHLCEDRQKEGSLSGSLWFIMYTTFFSIMSLVYFAAENPDNATTQDLMKDAISGKNVLASIAKTNMSADRCAVTLEAIFARLPEWMREGKPNPVPKKKRKQGADSRQVSGAQQQSIGRIGSSASLAPIDIVRGTSPGGMNPSPYTPQHSTFSSAPFTPTDYSPTTQTMQQFGLHSTPNAELPDVSSIIFPPTDSFSYPNQPLTTFENNTNFKDTAMYGMPAATGPSSMAHSGPASRAGSDSLEAQLYGLPPFVMQTSQWPTEMQGGQAAMPQQQAGQQFMMNQGPNGVPSNWPNQPDPAFQGQGYTEINLNDIFGGPEWPGAGMNQGYGG